MNSILIKTNIISDPAFEDVMTTFKADNRIFSIVPESTEDGYVLRVEADMDNDEVLVKFNSVGIKAVLMDL